MRFLSWIPRLAAVLEEINRKVDTMEQGLGRIQSQLDAMRANPDPAEAEFRVSSQWGEDGIIDRLVEVVAPARRVFVEFGVEDYRESNTRFLLRHRYWSGLVIDGSDANVRKIRSSDLYWRHNLKAEAAFIDRDNINQIIAGAGIEGEIGLLSVDIDGNDYWVWQAISVISPCIVVVEYNAIFGPTAAVTVPYNPAFRRAVAHPSNLYYGASIAALERLAAQKGYALVCCNSAGNNVFFVRCDLAARLPRRTATEAYRAACFREARDATGALVHLSQAEGRNLIADLPVVDVETGKLRPLSAIW